MQHKKWEEPHQSKFFGITDLPHFGINILLTSCFCPVFFPSCVDKSEAYLLKLFRIFKYCSDN